MRLVFDTNVVISSLIFNSHHTRFLREAWSKQDLIPIVSAETTRELLRVLQYPKFKLSSDMQMALAEEYLEYAETLASVTSTSALYPCSDPDDQKFLDLGMSSNAEGLITGDQDLLIMQKAFPIPILEIADLAKYLKQKH